MEITTAYATVVISKTTACTDHNYIEVGNSMASQKGPPLHTWCRVMRLSYINFYIVIKLQWTFVINSKQNS